MLVAEVATEDLDLDVIIDRPRNRFVGRTLVSERVRAVIANAREERNRAREQYWRAEDDMEDDFEDFGVEVCSRKMMALDHAVFMMLI